MTKIYIIRHGNSMSNVEKTFTGHIDSPLSNLGKIQAEKVCDFVVDNLHVDKIYSSDLTRAYNTVLPLAKKLNLEIIKNKGLREIYGGKWEGEIFADLPTKYPKDFSVWQKTPWDAVCTGGESYVQATERFIKSLSKIAEENMGKSIVVATHGGILRSFQCVAMGKPLTEMDKISYVINASVSEVNYSEGKFEWVKCFNTDYLDGLVSEMPKGI